MAEINYPQRWLKEAEAITSPEGWRKQITNELLKCQKGLNENSGGEVIVSKYGLRFIPNSIEEDAFLVSNNSTSVSLLNNTNYKYSFVNNTHKINFKVNLTETLYPVNVGVYSSDRELYDYYQSLPNDAVFIRSKNTFLDKYTRIEKLELNGMQSGTVMELTKENISFLEDNGKYYFIVVFYIIPLDLEGLYMSSIKMDVVVNSETVFTTNLETICDQIIT